MPSPIKHPATYSEAILDKIREILTEHVPANGKVLDPMAGVGTIHQLSGRYLTTGIELEPEWADQDTRTRRGSILDTNLTENYYDAVVVSPPYGNRMADNYAGDGSRRYTYRLALGRPLSENNAGGMQWGGTYRSFFEKAWLETIRVLKPGGIFVLNVKDHIRDGKRQYVAGWHVSTLCYYNLCLLYHESVPTKGIPTGNTAKLRTGEELLYVFRK